MSVNAANMCCHSIASPFGIWSVGVGGLLTHEGTKPGQLAFAVYCQLEADVDDLLAAQAVKCLVHLSTEMLQADRAAGHAPAAPSSHSPNISSQSSAASQQAEATQGRRSTSSSHAAVAAAEGEVAAGSESDEEEVRQDGMTGAAGLTLQGLVRRMVKLAGDR